MNTLMVTAALGTLAAAIWVFLFLKYHSKYDEILNTKPAREMKFSEIFFIGFGIMKLLKINITSEGFINRRMRISEIYGAKYAKFYTYLFAGAQITYAATLFPAALLLGAALGSPELSFIGAAAAGLMLFYIDFDVKKKVNEKHGALLCELPDMILRLVLLMNAGMVLREAWNMIAVSSDTLLCREMRQTSEDIRNGIPENEAFEAFADRCKTKEIRKFISTLTQNIKKGSEEISGILQASASEQWEEKKNFVRKKAADAEQKLLFPMVMIFAAIIMMIIVPIFTNMF